MPRHPTRLGNVKPPLFVGGRTSVADSCSKWNICAVFFGSGLNYKNARGGVEPGKVREFFL